MKTASLILGITALTLTGCGDDPPPPAAAPQEVRTIDNTPLRMTTIEVPPTVREQQVAPTQEKTNDPFGKRDPQAATATNLDQLNQQMELPFAPAIAMDPVDGGKVSVRANTPMVEYKKKLYYFTSEQNRRAFIAAPEQYLKGNLAKY